MYTKLYTLRFPSLTEAKVAVSFLSEEIASAIADHDIASANILLEKEGSITVMVRFDTMEEMKSFTRRRSAMLESLKKSFPLRLTETASVAVFTFEREAATTV